MSICFKVFNSALMTKRKVKMTTNHDNKSSVHYVFSVHYFVYDVNFICGFVCGLFDLVDLVTL